MALVKGGPQLEDAFARADLHLTRAVGAHELHIPPLAKAHHLDVVSQVRLQQRLARRNHDRRPRRQAGDQLGLGRGDRLQRAEQLQVHRADIHDRADVGPGDLNQLCDLTGPAHRHLEHECLRVGGGREQRQRQPDLGVVVFRTRGGAQMRAQERDEDVLSRGLAGRPGDRNDPGRAGPQLGAPRARERLQAAQRIVVLEHDALGCDRSGVRRRHEHAPRSGRERLPGVGPAVRARAGQPDEQLAALQRARIDRRPRRPLAGIAAIAEQARAGGIGDARRRPSPHRRLPPAQAEARGAASGELTAHRRRAVRALRASAHAALP